MKENSSLSLSLWNVNKKTSNGLQAKYNLRSWGQLTFAATTASDMCSHLYVKSHAVTSPKI